MTPTRRRWVKAWLWVLSVITIHVLTLNDACRPPYPDRMAFRLCAEVASNVTWVLAFVPPFAYFVYRRVRTEGWRGLWR